MQGETASAGIKATGKYPEDLAKMINYGGYTKLLAIHFSNTMDRGAQWATVHRVTKSQTRLSTHMLNNTFPVQVKQTSTGRKCCLGCSQVEKRGQCLASKDRLILL